MRRTLTARRLGRLMMWLAGTTAALLWIFPIYWMFVTSIKPEGLILSSIGLIPTKVTMEHYIGIFRIEPLVLRWFLNSVVVTTSVVAGSLLLGSIAGYALARMHFPGRNLIFWLMVGSLMIPGEMSIVPLFIAVLKLNLANTYWALILPPLSSVFVVYLYRQFFIGFPQELEDAAAIDGCGKIRTFLRIALPPARPATLAAGILVFTGNWNSFLWPLLVAVRQEWKTLTVGMSAFRIGGMPVDSSFGYGSSMASAALVAIPTLVFFFTMQRYFIESVTTVGITG